jgi:hypothetical protein
MSALGHSRPSHFVPVLNNVRYASDSDHSRYESELTLWATSGLMHCSKPRQERLAYATYSATLIFSLSAALVRSKNRLPNSQNSRCR